MRLVVLGIVVLMQAGPVGAESLWRETAGGAPGGFLFTDVRARRVGDLLTVLVVESASSNVQASTETKKDSSSNVNLSGANVLGIKMGQMLGAAGTRGLFSHSGTSQHAGSGAVNRTEAITAQIPARVVKVLEGGALLVEGRRVAVVNDETTTLAFSGIVRPEDITPDNTVRSTQVADAEVTMLGKGVLQEKQRPGIINRLLDIFRIF